MLLFLGKTIVVIHFLCDRQATNGILLIIDNQKKKKNYLSSAIYLRLLCVHFRPNHLLCAIEICEVVIYAVSFCLITT